MLRAHRMRTDGTFHDLFGVDYKQTPWYEWREECASADRYRFELALHSRQALGGLVEQVLADAGVTRDDVRCVLMQNVTDGAYDFHAEMLGAPIHPVCRDTLAAHGHLGAMDVVLNLDRLLAQRRADRRRPGPGAQRQPGRGLGRHPVGGLSRWPRTP